MSNTGEKQIFQTSSPKQWRRFQWMSRIILFIAIVLISVLIITLSRGGHNDLPQLKDQNEQYKKILNPSVPITLTTLSNARYRGFRNYLLDRKKQSSVIPRGKVNINRSALIRAGFYVDWDPQSFYSLKANIDKMNMVIPEWFTIDPSGDSVSSAVDKRALILMKRHKVPIVPILSNINRLTGDWDGDLVHRVIANPVKRKRLIADILRKLQKYQLQGINVDLEELKENTDANMIQFQRDLYSVLHTNGLLVTQDVMPDNEDYNYRELNRYNDYIFIMAYDQHNDRSGPGAISEQKWIEKVLLEIGKKVPPSHMILCIAGYGYDWPKGSMGTTITYQEALSTAKENEAGITYDKNTYNLNFRYSDDNNVDHQVYFTDAATNFNTMRFADEFGTAGVALWRLGSEDSRLWNFYSHNLTEDSLDVKPVNFASFYKTGFNTDVDYVGDGEILDVLTTPSPGRIQLDVDTSNLLITGQRYIELPSRYVIKRYGKKDKQIVLTFDDGPDPNYTPAILDIIKREHVPATFFMVGIMAENNIPIVKRIYDEGYEIGNHTFTHPNMAIVGPQRAQLEMNSTRLLIESITGHSTIMFRAPYNADAEPESIQEILPVVLSKQQHFYTIGESIDPEDWTPGITADEIYKKVVKNQGLGNIILLHDAGGSRWATVAALPRIIEYFKKKGYRFTTVASLLNKTRDDMMPRVSAGLDYYLIRTNYVLASAGYWGGHFIFALFLISIILGITKILLLGYLAWRQRRATLAAAAEFDKLRGKRSDLVDIIVPAYNEEVNAVKTIQNLLQLDYPNFRILFVDDGSKDNTYSLVQSAFQDEKRVEILTKPNGGKASALNFGLALSDANFVVCIDADTLLKKDAVSRLMDYFYGDNVGAVAGNVKVGNESTILTIWQSIEYVTSQNFDRRAFDYLNCITVVPGAIGAFRKRAIMDAGGFTTDTLAEDCDLTIRILKKGYRIHNAEGANAITEAPETLNMFLKQRFRWSFGIMQAFWKHREACFNPQFGTLGTVALPNILIFQIILPLIAPLADFFMILGVLWGNGIQILSYYLAFMLIDAGVSVIAFIFEKERMWKILWLIPQRLVYRQLMYYILFKSIRKALKGELQTWGTLKRTGNVKEVMA